MSLALSSHLFLTNSVSENVNPFALRKAKIVYNFGLSECSRFKVDLFECNSVNVGLSECNRIKAYLGIFLIL